MVGMMLCCTDGFVLIVLEGRKLRYCVGCFDRTGDDMGGLCVRLGLGDIITVSEIYDMRLNDSSPVSCKS